MAVYSLHLFTVLWLNKFQGEIISECSFIKIAVMLSASIEI